MITEEQIKKLEDEFSENINIFLEEKDNTNLLDNVYKLSFILSNIKALQASHQQIEFMTNSQEVMKNVDFSKIDINSVLRGIMGGEM